MKRGTVADVLVVPAIQLGHPVANIVWVVAGDRPFHRAQPRSLTPPQAGGPFFPPPMSVGRAAACSPSVSAVAFSVPGDEQDLGDGPATVCRALSALPEPGLFSLAADWDTEVLFMNVWPGGFSGATAGSLP